MSDETEFRGLCLQVDDLAGRLHALTRRVSELEHPDIALFDDPSEKLHDALYRISQWCRAYPVEVFTPISDERIALAASILKLNEIDIGAMHAQWARHILDGIAEIADQALTEDDMEAPTRDYGSIGWAVNHLRLGHKLFRRGWNSKNLWVVWVPEGSTSIPHKFIGEFPTAGGFFMKTQDNVIIPWLASQTDLLSHDWALVDEIKPGVYTDATLKQADSQKAV